LVSSNCSLAEREHNTAVEVRDYAKSLVGGANKICFLQRKVVNHIITAMPVAGWEAAQGAVAVYIRDCLASHMHEALSKINLKSIVDDADAIAWCVRAYNSLYLISLLKL
jgi:hypothetical protein